MSWLDFANYSLWLNLALFVAGACAIWWAGTNLERQAQSISSRTGLGHAFVGVLLLAAATSLPEIATSVTAVLIGNVPMAVHNLLGGVVMQTGVLAVVDIVSGREALTHRAPRFVLLLQGLGIVFLLAIVLVGGSLGQAVERDATGAWPWVDVALFAAALLFAYLLLLHATRQGTAQPRWTPHLVDQADATAPAQSDEEGESPYRIWSSSQLYLAFIGCALVVLVGGWLVAQTGDGLAKQTGLSAGFVGATLVALATSLPELSVTVAAVRHNNHEMAISNVFGSNAFDVTLLAVVGLVGREALVSSGSSSATFAAGLGILVTCVYLWGMLERRDRTVLRMGYDSAIVLALALVGNAVIYALH